MTEKHSLRFYDKAVDYSREILIKALRGCLPNEPTVVPGWQARHLAAHLYLRERNFLALLGIMVKPLEKYTRDAVEKLASLAQTREYYQKLVESFAEGPSRCSPFRLHSVKRSFNISEFYVHAEDILRAHNASRDLSPDYEEALWNEIVTKGAFLYRSADVGIIAVRPGGQRHVVRKAPDSVAVVGEPGEIILHAFGRGHFARVQFQGDDDAVAILNSSSIGP